uniref:Beta-defensin-like domain-containing protein n=2 Tax=Anolis carolinensis TaxID=28377 RepID=A0A803SQX5_ANOCA
MKALFLLFAIFLISYQAVPGNAQGPHDDTIACGRGGGSCQPVPCRGLSVEAGTCQGGTMKCCRW